MICGGSFFIALYVVNMWFLVHRKDKRAVCPLALRQGCE